MNKHRKENTARDHTDGAVIVDADGTVIHTIDSDKERVPRFARPTAAAEARTKPSVCMAVKDTNDGGRQGG